MKTLTFALYNQIQHRSASYQDHIRFITEFSLNSELRAWPRSYTKPVDFVECNEINDALHIADAADSEYLYIVAYGHRSTDPHLPTRMIQYAEENNYAVLGHILQDNPDSPDSGFYSLHHQSLLINMNLWRQAKKPLWGNYSRISHEVLPTVQRSIENFHDNYTPLWIKPAAGQISYSGIVREGWQLISGMISHGLQIGNFPLEIRNSKMHLYPDSDILLEQVLANVSTVEPTEWNQAQYIKFTSFAPTQSCVFIYNTDNMIEEPMDYDSSTELDTIYCVAAGFKPLQLLTRCKWSQLTRMVYFDYSQSALDFKRWLVENWDGKNYPEAVDNYKKDVDTNFQPIWFVGKDQSGVWESTMEIFGGQDSWLELWAQYRKLEHRFIKTDLFGDCSQLLADMKSRSGYNLIWFSNTFNTEAAVRNFGRQRLNEIYTNFLADISSCNTTLQVCGTDTTGWPAWFVLNQDK